MKKLKSQIIQLSFFKGADADYEELQLQQKRLAAKARRNGAR